jgi:uncharacterized protein YndB with AHSA1/START domain
VGERLDVVEATYIESTPERVWAALTDADLTGKFWGHSQISEFGWQTGTRWEHRRTDGSGVAIADGTVIESAAPNRLTLTVFEPPGEAPEGGPSKVTFEIKQFHEIVKVTITHVNLLEDNPPARSAASWQAVLANLKTLLECGHVLPRPPWEMPDEPLLDGLVPGAMG